MEAGEFAEAGVNVEKEREVQMVEVMPKRDVEQGGEVLLRAAVVRFESPARALRFYV